LSSQFVCGLCGKHIVDYCGAIIYAGLVNVLDFRAGSMSKIRILYCIDSVEHDAGPDKQLAEMIRHIDKDRFDVHLCCVRDCARMRELGEGCTPVLMPMGSIYSPNGLRQIRRLRRYINQHRIDVVQTFMVKANILGLFAARRSHCKVLLSSRRNTNYWFRPFYRRLYRYMNRFTTRLVANSTGVKRAVVQSEGIAPDRVDVLYNGVDTTMYAPGTGDPAVPASLGIPPEAKVVGIVANLRPVKDHALFLRTARCVADQRPDTAFVIVGVGPLRDDLAALARQLGLSNVYFSDGKGAVPDYLDRMTAACLTSTTEGFSNAILEYMAAGLPTVATDVGGNAEALEHGLSGYVIADRDPAALAAPIVDLLTDDAKREEMGRRALERCRDVFDIRQTIRRYEDHYQSLVTEVRQ
jgi:L-malate glycosyltransferase